jgi:hypothetical protein
VARRQGRPAMEWQKRSGGGRRPAQGHDVEGGRRGEALDPGRGGADRAETTWGGTEQSSEVRGDGARVAAAQAQGDNID